jgi:hypothetical protein
LEAVPVLQRLDVVGALSKSTPFAEPQTPFTPCDCTVAEQFAAEPPFTPWHVQDHGPVPVTVVEVPELHRFVVGAEVKVPPLLLPHAPFTSSTLAEQFAVLPPLIPAQVQTHKPDPLLATVEGKPVLQRL